MTDTKDEPKTEVNKNSENTKNVTLDIALKRGDKTHNAVNIRKPAAGDLRGTRLTDVANIEVDALIKVLPRISTPPLNEHELSTMNGADFLALGVVVSNFLEQKKDSQK